MLDLLFNSKLREKVLGWFLLHSDERFFVRQVSSILREDSTNVSRELARLAQAGVLSMRREGRQKYYQADKSCPVFEELRGLVLKTSGFAGILRAALDPLAADIAVAFVHGSFARGANNFESDIDMVIIGDVSFGDVAAAMQAPQEKLKREINPVVYSPDEFRDKLNSGNHFINEIQSKPKIFIVGGESDLTRLGQ